MRAWMAAGLVLAGCRAAAPTQEPQRPTLTLGTIALEPNGLRVSWSASDAEETTFSVEKRTLPSAEWRAIALGLTPSMRSFLDYDIEPGGAYLYRVSAHRGEESIATVETEHPVAGPSIWNLQFRGPSKPAQLGKGLVWVQIRKFVKGMGWVEKTHLHWDGDRIGWWAEREGEDPVHLHQVRGSDGKPAMVDFDTGMTLTSVAPVKKTVEFTRCKPIFNTTRGNQAGCEQVVEKRSFECYEITYQARDGIHRVNVPEPKGLDQLCSMHQAIPKASMDPRVAAAKSLLDEADRLWETDSARSIKLYQQLLQDYKDIVVQLRVRTKVEGRARQADD
jgi:hypothetical protein